MRVRLSLLTLACLACGERSAAVPLDEGRAEGEARWAIVRHLASDALEGRAAGSAGGKQARAAIIAELERCGVAPALAGGAYEQPTSGPGVNVLGHIPGKVKGRHVLVSAHYDHLGVRDGVIMNGADDNAAAVGSVLEVACSIARRGGAAATIIVAFWDAEEPPYFLTPNMGSRYWVEHPHVPLESVEAAVVLDLVGAGLWPGSPLHFALGAETSPALARAVDATPAAGFSLVQAGLHLVEALVVGGHQPWSDYHYLRAADIPVLFLSNGQSERYHTGDDDFATLDLDKLAAQTRWLTALVSRLGDATGEAIPRFSPFERPEVDREAARRLLGAALASGAIGERDALEADLAGLGSADQHALRAAVQRVQCLAAGHYPASLCRRLGASR
jgi:hypothetical protein